MKLVRYGDLGSEKLGLIGSQGEIRDLSDHLESEENIFSALPDIMALDINTLRVVENNPRLGACLKHVGKVICVGLNYVDHASEAKMEFPAEPILFMKATSSICGPDDDAIIPKGAQKTDWEVELGVVIGKSGSYIDPSDSMKHIAGYCVLNDLSDRGFQLEGTGQWVKGKSADTFCPLGPWLVTKDEVADPQNLEIWLEVNGERMQNGNTADMHFSVAYLVSYISRFMSLNPGDVIASGTPPGVGLGMNPPKYLKHGDTLRAGIAGLGVQRQNVRGWNE